MAEYIERDKVLEAILQLPPKMDEQGYGWLGRMGVWQMLSDFPSADVQPVKWFSVSEKLPEYGQNVIIVDNLGYYSVACMSVGRLFNEQEPWFYVDGEYESNVEYWMPIPESPLGGTT